MGKSLSDMTLEELWQLFPIFLTPHQDVWQDWYQEEAAILKNMLPPTAQLHHIGSTLGQAHHRHSGGGRRGRVGGGERDPGGKRLLVHEPEPPEGFPQ